MADSKYQGFRRKLKPLSAEAKMSRKPLPPEVFAGALQDHVHNGRDNHMTLQELIDTLQDLISKGIDPSTIVRIDKGAHYDDSSRVAYVVDSEVVQTHRESIVIG